MSIDFDDLSGITLGSSIDTTDTITNLNSLGSASVPEPSTTLLMGVSLLGLVGYSHKRVNNNS